MKYFTDRLFCNIILSTCQKNTTYKKFVHSVRKRMSRQAEHFKVSVVIQNNYIGKHGDRVFDFPVSIRNYFFVANSWLLLPILGYTV